MKKMDPRLEDHAETSDTARTPDSIDRSIREGGTAQQEDRHPSPRDQALEATRERNADFAREHAEDQHVATHGPPVDEPDEHQRADELFNVLLVILGDKHLVERTPRVFLAGTVAAALAAKGFGIACRECSDLHRALAELLHLVEHGAHRKTGEAWYPSPPDDVIENARRVLSNEAP